MEQESLAGSEFVRSSCSSQSNPTTEFWLFIDKLCPILTEIKDNTQVTELPAIKKAIDSLETDLGRAKAAMDNSNARSCPSPAKRAEELTQNLGRSLGLVLFASHEVPFPNKEKIEALCKEMMSVRFESTSYRESDFTNGSAEMEEVYEEDEIVEDTSLGTVGMDSVFLQMRSNDEAKFRQALLELNALIMNGLVSNDKLKDEDVITVLRNRLNSCEDGRERAMIIRLLIHLISANDENKEKIMDLGFLSALVKFLAGDVEEKREAVKLLLNLCEDDAVVRRLIGRIQGCIVMLVAISNGDDEGASHDARILLNAMSGNPQHTLYMAEAGYFKPLIKFLWEGSDMSKVLMATALSRMELTDENKISLGKDGAIEPLVRMFSTGNLEAKLSSLNALQNLSTSKPNIQPLIDSGIVVSLLQLLFSVTSVLMTLQEPASAILAKVALSESILIKPDIAQQMLSLLNLSSPVIQIHLLEALNNITSHANASKVRKKMKENGAIQLLAPFFAETDPKIRTGCLKLIYTLSKDMSGKLIEQLGFSSLNIIIDILSSSTSKLEKAAAFGILSNFPATDGKITEFLKSANLMNLLTAAMSLSYENPTPTMVWQAESIAGILIRFTLPTDKRIQHYSVENGVIPTLIKFLTINSAVARSKASLCLAQLSTNSLSLCKSQKLRCLFIHPSIDSFCKVHGGYCSVKSTFCLIKAGAIAPLIQTLGKSERGSDESGLSCLATLLQNEIWEEGSKYIAKMNGIRAVIEVLEFGESNSREIALWMLERMLRIDVYKVQYGESVKAVLVELARNGDHALKTSVAKLLAQLEVFGSIS